jgi:hypothetical protein
MITTPVVGASCVVGSDATVEAALNDTLLGDLLAAVSVGVKVEDYLWARVQGVANGDILGAYFAGSLLYYYTRFRMAGAGHDESIELDHEGIDHAEFSRAAKLGFTACEVLDARHYGEEIVEYIADRLCGVSHDELIDYLECCSYKSDLCCSARYCGATHLQVLEAAASGVEMACYVWAVYDGFSHDEIMAVSESGIDICYMPDK